MNAPRLLASLLLAASLAACRARPPAPAPPPPPAAEPADARVTALSPGEGGFVALAATKAHPHLAFVADEEDDAVLAVDLDAARVVGRHALAGAAGQLAVAPDGTVFVAARGEGKLVALRLREDGSLHEIARAPASGEPWGVAVTPDGARVLVTRVRDASLSAYAARDLTAQGSFGLSRDPRSVVVTDLGAPRAYVAHASGSTLSVVDLAPPAGRVPVREIPLAMKERRRDFGVTAIMKPLPPSDFDELGISSKLAPPTVRATMTRTASQGFALAAIGPELFLPETLVRTGDKTVVSSGYGSSVDSTLDAHVPFVARVTLKDDKPTSDAFSGPLHRQCFEDKRECLLPRAATTDGERLYVACLDADEILVVHPSADAEHAPSCTGAIAARRRIPVERPTAIAVDKARRVVVAYSSHTRELVVAGTHAGAPTRVLTVPRAGPAPSAIVAHGRRLFHETRDRRISGDGRACASCHVEGREDGLVWSTPKGARQTPMLAGRIAETAPYGWNGEHPTLATHITSTVKNLGGKGLPAEDLDALAAYVASMKPPPRAEALSEPAARGRAIFASAEAECSSCHVERLGFTDGDRHALETRGAAFDTPSLTGIAQTAPYFHDGRYATLEELVDRCDGVMGHTAHLSDAERRDLVAYLRAL